MSNLIPGQHKLTVEEQSEGGKKSAKVRSQRKRARDIANTIFTMPYKEGDLVDLEDITALDQIENADVLTTIIASLARKASEGSIRHIELLLTLTGDYSKKIDVKNEIDLEKAEAEVQELFANMDNSKREEDKRKTELFCKVNKYTYAWYEDTPTFKDFTIDDLEGMLEDIYTYGIPQTETWGRPLDKGALLDHIRKQIEERRGKSAPKTVEEILERTTEKVKADQANL